MGNFAICEQNIKFHDPEMYLVADLHVEPNCSEKVFIQHVAPAYFLFNLPGTLMKMNRKLCHGRIDCHLPQVLFSYLDLCLFKNSQNIFVLLMVQCNGNISKVPWRRNMYSIILCKYVLKYCRYSVHDELDL